jgi:hypothetical protein
LEGERLDFARSASVVAAGEPVGRLTHVVADPETRDEVAVGPDKE